MRKMNFSIKLKAKDLYIYTLHHTYFSFSGVFSLLISLGSFLFFLLNLGKVETSTLFVLLLVALLFPVIQPILLYFKCRKQVRKSKDINDVLSYTLTEDKIEIRQGENSVEVPWYEIRKAVYLKSAIYLYMSPVRAFIFPKDECGGQFADIVQLVKEGMERYKDYEPEPEVQEEKRESGEKNDGENMDE
ncbi:MAG: YcxB family protein [Lachnospiraceae bacterium]|nr:YcxB family protein [Lachnospiraceae bacterium]